MSVDSIELSLGYLLGEEGAGFYVTAAVLVYKPVSQLVL